MSKKPASLFWRVLNRIYVESCNKSGDKEIVNREFTKKFIDAGAYLQETANSVFRPYAIAKAHDIHRMIDQVRPKSVIEIGSGKTSLVFAYLSQLYGFSYTSFEQNPEWADIVNDLFDMFSITDDRPVKYVPVITKGEGARFEEDVPAGTELLYVDAPYVPDGKGRKFNTYTGKPEFYDAVDFLSNGGNPKAIIVDGRTDTTDLILKTDFASLCDFKGCYIWSMERCNIGHALRFNRHSSFIKK